ncbi:MAG: GtrA family protein [Dokdonella sp.]|nr:GtrA family protein [Dokdonella sp.]
MRTDPSPPVLARQGSRFLLVGGLQLLLDWLVFVLSTSMGVPAAPGNVAGRVTGALLGFWLHGRVTFARPGERRLGWRRFLRYLVVWLALTTLSTALVGLVAAQLGLQQAWLAKPLVEGALAVLAFFLWRQVVYR